MTSWQKRIPQEQYDKVFSQEMCDIDYEFIGFTNFYEPLAKLIPKHFTIIDFGCAYAPQAFMFDKHKKYVGVDISNCKKFSTKNTKHFHLSTDEFIKKYKKDFNQDTTFAICIFVPPWEKDSMPLVRKNFKNCFVYYPAGYVP